MLQVPVSKPGYSAKSIIDPRFCLGMQNHYCWSVVRNGSIEWKPRMALDPINGLLHHYKWCHFPAEECQQLLRQDSIDNTAFRYRAALVPRVLGILAEIGF
jgi:hypothetical protein